MFEITEACEPQDACTSCAVLSDLDGLEIACEHKKRKIILMQNHKFLGIY